MVLVVEPDASTGVTEPKNIASTAAAPYTRGITYPIIHPIFII
jgi:hypothetical protein